VTGALGLVLLAVAAGCRSAPRSPTGDSNLGPQSAAIEPYAPPASDAIPPWLADPLSWDKLARVETWMGAEGQYATPQWRNEAELVLNSGRVDFARREVDQDAAKSAAVAPRVGVARAGLERLLARDDLNAGQRARATTALERAQQLETRVAAGPKKGAIPLVARAEWGALKAKPALMDRTAGTYSRITIHHSADNDPVELDGSRARTFEAARDIQRAHMNGKETHYGDIGYHFLIDPYGRVLEGRDLTYQGAHAKGENNVRNVGICLIGNFDQEKPTEAALTALRRLVDDLRSRYGIERSRVYGHRDLRTTRCPGEHLARWVQIYRGGPPGAVTAQAASPRRATRNVR
jgi:N-acetylmuramoyl-L-alanine amidase